MSLYDKCYVAFTMYYCFAAFTFLRAMWFMVCPPNPVGKLRWEFIVARFDMWVGAYTKAGDATTHKGKSAYWFPVPFMGIKWYREDEQ